MKFDNNTIGIRGNARGSADVLKRIKQGAYLVGGALVLFGTAALPLVSSLSCGRLTNSINAPRQDTTTQTLVSQYSPEIGAYGQQRVVDTLVGGKIITETTSFGAAPLVDYTDSAGGSDISTRGGPGQTLKCLVSVLGTDYILPNFDSSGMVLAKESVAGIINQGEYLSVGGLRFQLDTNYNGSGDVTHNNLVYPQVAISLLDTNGNVLKKDMLLTGETKSYTVAGKTYPFHVYRVAPGYTFGPEWAEVAVFSKMTSLKDGGTFTTPSNDRYSFNMAWSGDTLTGWTFKKLQ